MPQAVLNSRKPVTRFCQSCIVFYTPVVLLAVRELAALASLAASLTLGLAALAEGVSRLGSL